MYAFWTLYYCGIWPLDTLLNQMAPNIVGASIARPKVPGLTVVCSSQGTARKSNGNLQASVCPPPPPRKKILAEFCLRIPRNPVGTFQLLSMPRLSSFDFKWHFCQPATRPIMGGRTKPERWKPSTVRIRIRLPVSPVQGCSLFCNRLSTSPGVGAGSPRSLTACSLINPYKP